MRATLLLPLLGLSLAAPPVLSAADGVAYPGGPGPGEGKHIVLISGDEEYRSEESLPMLGRILSRHHGFRCTVLFAIDKETGEIDPETLDHIPGLEALATADLMVIDLRFRDLPGDQMRHIDAYLEAGKPVVGIRPSVVAFRHRTPGTGPFDRHSCDAKLKGGFGLDVLGADWKAHHGHHGRESTLGIPAPEETDHPVLRGVEPFWGPTDVYAVATPIGGLDSLLVQGQVLEGMERDSPPSAKARMPLAWTRRYDSPAGRGRVFTTTMGDARDFLDENLRRLFVNACYWAAGLEDEIPARGEVGFVGPYHPSPFGFGGFVKGRRPEDHALPEPLFEQGGRIALVGNTLADRMQHHGWTETFLQARHPEKNLAFRNLGFAADELEVRPRSLGFGPPEAHLAHSRADLVFAFFGYNESFRGEAGLAAFREQLGGFIDDTRSQRYNGESAPRLVLFSPIAHEDLDDPNLPDGAENNARLALYTRAMAEVARERRIRFVDLFHPTRDLYARHPEPLTVNGIHLNEAGYRLLGELIDETLSGGPNPASPSQLEELRRAVLDKNLRWFNRYRATDGYSTYGKRADLAFVDGQTNRDVMARELEILDGMTANRDRRIWNLAQGRDLPVDDSRLPPPLEVKSNFGQHRASGELVEGGTIRYLDPDEAIGRMRLAPGMEIKPFASERDFPELVNPVQMSFDTDGRLWVAAWPSYPHWNPLEPLGDKLLILPDDDGDGRADRCQVFADELHNPTGFEFWNGGVIVACPPEILFLKDNDGDDRADLRIHLASGIDSADTHCGANSFVHGPDGWIYFSEGIFHFTNIETPWGGPLRTEAPMLYRFNPRTHEIKEHFRISPNPHGIVIDPWGRLFATDGTTGRGYYVGYANAGTPHDLYEKRVRPVAGLGRISSSHFPPENRGNLLICNTIGFLGILQHRVAAAGADFRSEEVDPVVVSTDPNFRPVDVETGADGALYFLDWHNALIGHMQHNLRDPNRDRSHGRVYRVTAVGRPLLEPVKMRARSIPELVALLASPEEGVRYRARLELSGRDSDAVLAAARERAATLDASAEAEAMSLLELLWLHQQHNRIDRDLLLKTLASPRAEARAAATRVLGQWGGRIADGPAILQRLAADPSALVRAEAIVAATSFSGLEAAEVLFIANRHPRDAQIDFNIARSRETLDPHWRAALAAGGTLSRAGQEFVRGIEALPSGPSGADLHQDSAKDLLHLHLETPPRAGSDLRGISFTTKAVAGESFTLYQLRPGGGKGSYEVVRSASFTSDGASGEKSLAFDPPWPVAPGDLFAHSGNGGPAYWLHPADVRDVLYHPVAELPAPRKSYDLGPLKRLPQRRRYALRFLQDEPASPKADVVIRTIPEQLKYDRAEFSVKAGRPFVLLFVNPDNMPHNFVVTLPGAGEEVGLLADAMAADPEAVKRHYVPDSPKVLFATSLLGDHSEASFEFTAPKEPGEYPFLCTFPGHWRIMRGVMKVVE